MPGLLRTIRALRLGTRPPQTHDYGPGQRGWGHDYTFSPSDGGQTARMNGWGSGIAPGDYLLIEHRVSPDGRTRYQVESITYRSNVPDMWHAIVRFAPRQICVAGDCTPPRVKSFGGGGSR